MPENKPHTTEFDWRVTSFDGARREQLRRWSQLPLEHILLAIEEMEEITRLLVSTPGRDGQSVGNNQDPKERGKSPTVS